jgi:hypothetical protein
VFLLWTTAIGFLWLLASTRNFDQWQPSSNLNSALVFALRDRHHR